MDILKKIMKSKYHLILTVLPVVILACLVKVIFHFSNLEIIPKEFSSFFPSILTGIIFILGFILAGVVTDYKESEKIPNEIATSLYIIWQESIIVKKNTQSPAADTLMDKIKRFIPILKNDFFIKGKENIFDEIDSFSDDFAALEKSTPPPFLARMKNEQANLSKWINRIKVIKDTDFAPSVMICIRIIASLFLLSYCFLKVDPWWCGILLVMIFTFVIFSIIILIADMEDPFEYDGDAPGSDEINLDVLTRLHTKLNSADASIIRN